MKKIIAMVLALAMVACLFAGCNNTPAEPENNSGTESTPVEGTSAGKIKVGAIGPITGGAAVYGIAVKNALELAVDEVNALGGIQFELDYQDDAHDPETSVNAYGNLTDWGMQVLVGPVTSGPAAAVSAEAEADHVFMLTPSASSPTVIDGKTVVFQMCFSDLNQGVGSADYIADNNLSDSIAVIYKSDDAYSTGIYNKFVEEAAVKSLNIVYTGTFEESSKTEFSAQLTAAQQAGATLIFLPIYAESIAPMMTQANSMGYDVDYFGVDGMDGILSVEGFDTTLAEGAYLLTPFSADATDEKTVAFVTAYEAKFSETPNQFAADAYDCIYSLYEACTAAGVTADMSASDICDALVGQYAGNITFTGVTGSGMTWDVTGAVSKSPMAVVIKDGVYVSAK